MPNVRAYKGFDDQDLAGELVLLNKRRKSIYESQSIGGQSYQKNLDRIDRQFAAAMEEWQRRGGKGIPKSDQDVPGGGGQQAFTGTTDYSDVQL